MDLPASTLEVFTTSLGHLILVKWSYELPILLCLYSSTLITFGWDFRGRNHHLSPAVTSLVVTSFCTVVVLLVLGEGVRLVLDDCCGRTAACVPD